jgi:hypothetical protein
MGARCQSVFTSRSDFASSRLFPQSRQQGKCPVNFAATSDYSDNATANDDNDDHSG